MIHAAAAGGVGGSRTPRENMRMSEHLTAFTAVLCGVLEYLENQISAVATRLLRAFETLDSKVSTDSIQDTVALNIYNERGLGRGGRGI